MEKNGCLIHFDTTSCNIMADFGGSLAPCHTTFSVFFLGRKHPLPCAFEGNPDEVAEVALLEVAHFERQRIHVRGRRGSGSLGATGACQKR